MKDLYDLINIRKINVESTIKESIEEVREELKGLDTERMCKVYTSYLYSKLKEKGLLVRIIDTESDLNMDYKHYFLIIPNNEVSSYIIDLTYSQFIHNSLFDSLYNNGYQLVNNDEYQDYLNNIINSLYKKR